MQSERIIIGLVGETGSGKDTVAGYLRNRYGAYTVRFADPIKETFSLFFNRFSKEDQAWLAMRMKERFGKNVLGHALRRRIHEVEGIVSVNGLRFPEDYDFVKSFPESMVIYVTAPQKLRWERTRKRGEKTDDESSFEKFQEFEQSETESHIPDIGARADVRIENTGTLEDLIAAVDKAVQSAWEGPSPSES